MKILFRSLIVVFILGVLHFSGMYGLYDIFPNLDIVNHIIGGLALALFVRAFLDRFIPKINKKDSFTFFATLILGIIWEIFEAYFGISGHVFWSRAYRLDTLKDLVDDMIGATIALYWIYKIKK